MKNIPTPSMTEVENRYEYVSQISVLEEEEGYIEWKVRGSVGFSITRSLLLGSSALLPD